MPLNFIPCDRNQVYLMPPSLEDWLSKDHLAWFVLDAVAQMDLGPFNAKRRADGWGRAAYPPSMMVPLLLSLSRKPFSPRGGRSAPARAAPGARHYA